jgi:hypothetical protein
MRVDIIIDSYRGAEDDDEGTNGQGAHGGVGHCERTNVSCTF